jgi:hypothetical protein
MARWNDGFRDSIQSDGRAIRSSQRSLEGSLGGTKQWFENRGYRRGQSDSENDVIEVYHHDVEAERKAEEERMRRNREFNLAALNTLYNFWIKLPYDFIRKIYLNVGFKHIISVIFVIALLYHMISLYYNPSNLNALFWCGAILGITILGSAIKATVVDSK